MKKAVVGRGVRIYKSCVVDEEAGREAVRVTRALLKYWRLGWCDCKGLTKDAGVAAKWVCELVMCLRTPSPESEAKGGAPPQSVALSLFSTSSAGIPLF